MSSPPDAFIPAQRLARTLLSGDLGLTLYARLAEEFPAITRHDVFYGVSLAWTELSASLLAAEAEVHDLRQRLAAHEMRSAA